MFTLRVSSLNYALRCSVVSVPGLIWMFERRSEGWKKRSQTGNSAPLMSSQKTDIFAQNSSQGIMHDRWFGMHWMRTREHFWSITVAEPSHTQLKCLLQVNRAFQAEPCVCLHCQDLQCVFKCPPESERVKRDPNGKIQGEYWGVDCGVKWHIYQNRGPLP